MFSFKNYRNDLNECCQDWCIPVPVTKSDNEIISYNKNETTNNKPSTITSGYVKQINLIYDKIKGSCCTISNLCIEWSKKLFMTSTLHQDHFFSPVMANNNKMIYFIRHGLAYCNICSYEQWKKDQGLTPMGWLQVENLKAYMNNIKMAEVSVTSKLINIINILYKYKINLIIV